MFFCGKSDIGKVRTTNQDSYLSARLYDNVLLCIVCDGMGGANGGNIASALAIKVFADTVRRGLSDRKQAASSDGTLLLPAANREEDLTGLLLTAAKRANTAVYDRSGEDEALSGMGTTLIAVLIADDILYALHIGDSRLYQITKAGLRRLTRDHSYVQYLVDIGKMTEEEAENASIRNIITRSVGTEYDVTPDVYRDRLQGGGYLLLCTDGLTNYVSEDEILETVTAPCVISEITDTDYELEDKTDRLIELANRGGGGDNITAILIKYDFTPDTEKPEPHASQAESDA